MRWLIAPLALCGCFVDLDLAGKACSATGACATGYTCDTATRTCVPADSESSCPALIQVADLRALWATPNTIRWGWSSSGDRNDFLSYELVVGRSEADVASRQNVMVFGAEQNPELGRFLLERTGGIDEVVATSSDGLDFDTFYFAQLIATDTKLCAAKSNIAGGHTGIEALLGSLPVFVDDAVAFVLPNCTSLGTDGAFAGSAYEYRVLCNPGVDDAEGGCASPSVASTCWVNLNLGIAPADLTGLSAIELETAYLEFALRIDQSEHAYWGAAGMGADVPPVGTIETEKDFFSIQPLTYRSDGFYRVYQISLGALTSGVGMTLTEAVLTTPVSGLQVGGHLDDGATVRLDEARIRW